MLGEVTTVYVFLIELGSLLLYCYRVFGVRRRIPSTLLVGIACFAVYYAVNKLADNNVAVNKYYLWLLGKLRDIEARLQGECQVGGFSQRLACRRTYGDGIYRYTVDFGLLRHKYSRLQVKRCAVCHGGGNRQNIVPYFLPCDFQFHLA